MNAYLANLRSSCIACGLLISVFAGASPVFAVSVKVGDSKADVQRTLGVSDGRLVCDGEETCTYPSGTIVFVDGKVAKVSFWTDEELKARKEQQEQRKVLEAKLKKDEEQRQEEVREQKKLQQETLQELLRAEEVRRSSILADKVIALIEYAIEATHMSPSAADALRSEFVSTAKKRRIESAVVSEWERDPYVWQSNHKDDIRSAKRYVSHLSNDEPIVQSMLYAFRRHDDSMLEGIGMKGEREQAQIKSLLLSRLLN